MKTDNIKIKTKINETLYIALIFISSFATAGFAIKKGGLNTLIFELFSIPIGIHGILSIYFIRNIIKRDRSHFGGILNKALFFVIFLICTFIYFIGTIQGLRVDLFFIFLLFLILDISNLLSIVFYVKLNKLLPNPMK